MGMVQTSGKKVEDAVNGARTYTMPGNFTANNSGVVTIAHYDGGGLGAITGVTIGGTAATLRKRKVDVPTGFIRAEVWAAQNIAGGTPNFVVTMTGTGSQYISCGCEEWDNFAASAFDQSGSAEGVSTAPSATTDGATAQADEVSYAVFADATTSGSNWGNTTPPTGYTEVWDETDVTLHQGGSAAYKVLSSIVTETATFTSGTTTLNPWDCVIVTFKLNPTSANNALAWVRG